MDSLNGDLTFAYYSSVPFFPAPYSKSTSALRHCYLLIL